MQWSTERAGDFLITTYLEDCEVGGCAKACSVQVGDNQPGDLHLSTQKFTSISHTGASGDSGPAQGSLRCKPFGS